MKSDKILFNWWSKKTFMAINVIFFGQSIRLSAHIGKFSEVNFYGLPERVFLVMVMGSVVEVLKEI